MSEYRSHDEIFRGVIVARDTITFYLSWFYPGIFFKTFYIKLDKPKKNITPKFATFKRPNHVTGDEHLPDDRSSRAGSAREHAVDFDSLLGTCSVVFIVLLYRKIKLHTVVLWKVFAKEPD